MISFRATEEEAAFVAMAKDLAKNKIRGLARDCEERRQVDIATLKEVAELGFLSLELPEDWEGLELPLITQAQIYQALSYGDLGIVQGLTGAGDAASLIRLLAKSKASMALDGLNETSTIALIDEGEDDPFGISVTLTCTEEGYVLNGTSRPTRLAVFAEYVMVAAKASNGEDIILLLDNPVQWQVGKGDYRFGLLASGIAGLLFDHVKVHFDQVLAKGQSATELMTQARTRMRILQAAKEVGLMDAALTYATEYTARRKSFGQEIAKFQGVSFRIAKMAIETRIANHLVWEAALKADQNDVDADGYALRALYRAHRSVRYVTDSAVQLLGGHGYVQEFPVEKWMRDAQAQVVLYGREKDLLIQRGEQIMGGTKEVALN